MSSTEQEEGRKEKKSCLEGAPLKITNEEGAVQTSLQRKTLERHSPWLEEEKDVAKSQAVAKSSTDVHYFRLPPAPCAFTPIN